MTTNTESEAGGETRQNDRGPGRTHQGSAEEWGAPYVPGTWLRLIARNPNRLGSSRWNLVQYRGERLAHQREDDGAVECAGSKVLQQKPHNPLYHGLMINSKSLGRSSSFVVPFSMPPIALNPSSWAFIPQTPQYFDARTRYRATPRLRSRKVQSSGTSASSGAQPGARVSRPMLVSESCLGLVTLVYTFA